MTCGMDVLDGALEMQIDKLSHLVTFENNVVVVYSTAYYHYFYDVCLLSSFYKDVTECCYSENLSIVCFK